MDRLAGKIAIITGSGSGVGAATAKLFAAEGATVVLSARRVEKLRETADAIEAAGGTALFVPSDISKPEDAAHLMDQTIEKFGTIDILVNNAGILDKNLNGIDQVDYADLDRVIATNEKGTMYCMSEALRRMKSGAAIVNIASVAGVNGGGGAAYVATKSAVIGITKHAALKFAKDGIRVNAICPGMIMTDMNKSLDQATMDQKMMGAMAQHSDLTVPPCQAEDVANIALFLASDEARALDGQIIVADFGANL